LLFCIHACNEMKHGGDCRAVTWVSVDKEVEILTLVLLWQSFYDKLTALECNLCLICMLSTITWDHQNIRSLHNHKDELNAIFRERNLIPHCIYLSEHPLKDNEITDFSLPRYNRAAKFCWNKYQKGGVYFD